MTMKVSLTGITTIIGVPALYCSILVAVSDPSTAQAQDKESVAAASPDSIVDTHDLMEMFNEPLYEDLKVAMKEEPTSEDQWTMIHEHGLKAAEIANLVAMRQQGPDWNSHSTDMQEAGTALADAASNQDFQATTEAWKNLVQSCNACHDSADSTHAPSLNP